MPSLPVALYIPNLLGYARIVLAFVGLQFASTKPETAVTIWIVSAMLDLFDGLLARALNQTSSFGVLLDIAADSILRSCVWVAVAVANPAYTAVACFLVSLESVTMLVTQLHAASHGTHWKEARRKDPWLVRAFFSRNFRNPVGVLGIYGLFSANLFAFGSQHAELVESIPLFQVCKYTAFFGRLLSMSVELWLCHSYLSHVLEKDAASKRAASKTD